MINGTVIIMASTAPRNHWWHVPLYVEFSV